MSNESAESEFFASLYRFAWILLLREDMARKVVLDALGEVHVRTSHSHEDAERTQARLFQVVRQRALKANVAGTTPMASASSGWPIDAEPYLTAASASEIAAALHRTDEPGRSALALVLLDAVEVESMEKILGLSITQLAEATDRARAAVAQALRTSAEVKG